MKQTSGQFQTKQGVYAIINHDNLRKKASVCFVFFCVFFFCARIAQPDQVEAARKEAERVRLTAECAAAAAVSKVHKDAIKEDNEQYLGFDGQTTLTTKMKVHRAPV